MILAWEHSVALKDVVAQVQVHPCFVELQFRPAHENALHRNFDWYSEVEANVRCPQRSCTLSETQSGEHPLTTSLA